MPKNKRYPEESEEEFEGRQSAQGDVPVAMPASDETEGAEFGPDDLAPEDDVMDLDIPPMPDDLDSEDPFAAAGAGAVGGGVSPDVISIIKALLQIA